MRSHGFTRLLQLYFLCTAGCMLFLSCATANEEDGIKGPAIGIDLGTTYSCVGIYKNGRVEIIPNDQGNRITPSYVAFTNEGERLVGEAAKNQATINPENTAYSVKRLIGRRYTDETVQSDKKLLSYEIVSKDGKPYLRMSVNGKPRDFAPEEISAMVLLKMKQIAATYLGQDVVNAVVTVPAYFTDSQRQATKDAGKISGLNVLRIINEPTAAAIAYGLDKKGIQESNILVYDLGGGTFDVSLLTIENGLFEVVSTNGDTHLGGEDFDQRTMDYFMKLLKQKHNKDISKDKRAIQKLKREVEIAKRTLSSTHHVTIEIEQLVPGFDMSETLSRVKFEELNSDLFKKTLDPLKQVLEDARLDKQDVDEIVFVGGSTRIPKIQKLVKEFFDGKEPNLGINPDEAVAYGAAVEAGILVGEAGEEISDVLLIDVTPLSLGVRLSNGTVSPLIPRGSVIPATKTQIYVTSVDNQPQVEVEIYEGERVMYQDNHLLGQFTMTNIRQAPKGDVSFEVTFDIDVNGILTVTALEKGTDNKGSITIENSTGRLSKEDIERMVREAEEFAEQDKEAKATADARYALESYLMSVRNTIEDPKKMGESLEDGEKEQVQRAVEEAQEWMKEHENASKTDYQEKLKAVQKICDPIMIELSDDEDYDEETEGHDDL